MKNKIDLYLVISLGEARNLVTLLERRSRIERKGQVIPAVTAALDLETAPGQAYQGAEQVSGMSLSMALRDLEKYCDQCEKVLR